MLKKIVFLTLFSIAMGFLETTVVIYLRELYYPSGFQFPLKPMKSWLILTELCREAATLLMIAVVAWQAGANRPARFAWFLYVFAIWDLFYYVFLKLILNWPLSWLTWDVLFLIPCLWVGPVLAPVILCLLMIFLWGILLFYDQQGYLEIRPADYGILILSSLILIANFCLDYLRYHFQFPPDSALSALPTNYYPKSFNWGLFALGCSGIGYVCFRLIRRNQGLLHRLKRGQLF